MIKRDYCRDNFASLHPTNKHMLDNNETKNRVKELIFKVVRDFDCVIVQQVAVQQKIKLVYVR